MFFKIVTLTGTFLALCSAFQNGEKAVEGQYKFMVSLQSSNQGHVAGGALLTFQLVLTSANILKLNPALVKVGSVEIDEGQRYEIKKSFPHPNYNQDNLDNNLAIVKTRERIQENEFVEPISLHTNIIDEKKMVQAMGWGFLTSDQDNANLDDNLYYGSFKTLSGDTCKERIAGGDHEHFFNENVLCVEGSGKGETWARYDWGGPVIMNNEIVGVMMLPCYDYTCAPNQLMAVRVQPYFTWIMDFVSDQD